MLRFAKNIDSPINSHINLNTADNRNIPEMALLSVIHYVDYNSFSNTLFFWSSLFEVTIMANMVNRTNDIKVVIPSPQNHCLKFIDIESKC